MGMPHSSEKSKGKAKMFNEIEVENAVEQQKQEHRRVSPYFFGDSRFDNVSINKNTNNQNTNYNQDLTQTKRENDYNSFKINVNGDICEVQTSDILSKTRSRTSPHQLETLESVCRTTLKPNKDVRVRLAKELNMSERQVQIWFQNKRAKSKKFAVKPNIQAPDYGFNYSGYINTQYDGRYPATNLQNNEEMYQMQENGYDKHHDFYYTGHASEQARYLNGYCNTAYTPLYADNTERYLNGPSSYYDYPNAGSNFGQKSDYSAASESAAYYYNNNDFEDIGPYYYDGQEDHNNNLNK